MSKVNIIVLAFVSLMLANTLASGQGGKPSASVRKSAAASGERTTELAQTARAFHDPHRGP